MKGISDSFFRFKFAQGECSVYALEVKVDGKVICGTVKEKEMAFNQVENSLRTFSC